MRPITTLLRTFLALTVLAGLASAIGAYLARTRITSSGEPADDEIDVVAIYGTRDLVSRASALRRATVTAWYGGGTLDLRAATLDPAGATLTIRTIFGGYRLVVPETWRVELSTIGVFGGIGDARNTEHMDPIGPVLTIDGFAVFGGVGIVAEAPDLDRATSAPDQVGTFVAEALSESTAPA